MSALRKPEDVAADLARSHEVNDKGEELILAGIDARDREVVAWLLRVSETAGMTPGGKAALGWCALQLKSGEGGMPVRQVDPLAPEEHPLDDLRRRARLRKDPVEMYAVDEIDRLTEALAAAVRERDDNAADRDAYAALLRAPSSPTVPSPLVALASEIARGPMGQGLVAWLEAEPGRVLRVDRVATADNVLAVARCILGAT